VVLDAKLLTKGNVECCKPADVAVWWHRYVLEQKTSSVTIEERVIPTSANTVTSSWTISACSLIPKHAQLLDIVE
jgi:hypothetical protein